MEYSYLYIDDNSEENASGIITGLNSQNVLNIQFDNPKGQWEAERNRILSDEFKNIDGLLLDLNLEEMPNNDKQRSLYKGSTLAQEIRNLSKAGEIRELPIILLSATTNLNKYFDKTNEDLFDLIIHREDLGSIYVNTRMQLIALAKGYKEIQNFKNENSNKPDTLFNHDMSQIDSRFISEFSILLESPVHTVSNFLIKHFLKRNGILITEQILATRLGVSYNCEGWNNLKESLSPFKYNGVYHEGWERWWMVDLENWWKENFPGKSFRNLKSTEKVELLSTKGYINLSPIIKHEKSKNDTFWTNCIGSAIPIDTIDGILIASQDNNYPWQDKSYISFEEALKPTNKTIWKNIASIEEFKLEQLKKKFPNERPKRQ